MNSCFAAACQRGLLWLAFSLAAAAVVHSQTAVPVSPDRVTFFTEPNFRGEALTVEAGASVENLDRMMRQNQQPWTFAISSVRVEGAARGSIFSGPGYSGDRLEITRTIADLYAERRGSEPGATWDRAVASITVTGPQRTIVVPAGPTVRPEPPPTTVYVVPAPPPPGPSRREIRPQMDPRSAEIIVQHAFREVLNRPADPEGMRMYRDRLMHDGWSEQQIIQQLQRSNEARGINADDAIRRAYREVLGRDPDANGLAHYKAKWRDGWTQGQIRDDLRRSTEGKTGAVHNAITRAYRELLGREPDPAGYATYERLMREKGMSERELRATLMSGDEYRQRQRGKR